MHMKHEVIDDIQICEQLPCLPNHNYDNSYMYVS